MARRRLQRRLGNRNSTQIRISTTKRGDRHFNQLGGANQSYLLTKKAEKNEYVSRDSWIKQGGHAAAAAAAAEDHPTKETGKKTEYQDKHKGKSRQRCLTTWKFGYLLWVLAATTATVNEPTSQLVRHGMPRTLTRGHDPNVAVRIGEAATPAPNERLFLNIGRTLDEVCRSEQDRELDTHHDEEDELQNGGPNALPPELAESSDDETMLPSSRMRNRPHLSGSDNSASDSDENTTLADKMLRGMVRNRNGELENVRNGVIVAPRDTWLDKDQISKRTTAEASQGIRNTTRRPKRKYFVNKQAPQPEGQLFVKATSFLGHVAGYIFKTGENGIGYHRDDEKTPAAETAAQEEGFGEPDRDSNNPGKHTPSIKKKDDLGVRIREPTRRQNCRRDYSGKIPDVGKLADCWGPSEGFWTGDTVNSNSWDSLVSNILGRSKADALFTQETRVRTEDKRTSASREASKLGWTASLGLALRTAADRGSGGCGVLVKKGIGLCRSTHEVKPALRHRIHHAWMGGITKGGVHCISAYLRDGEDASEGNLEILTEVAILVKSLKGQWIVAGDFNMSPTTLAATNWHKLIGGRILAPHQPTCLSQTYDYFVVKAGFAQAVEKVQVLDDGGLFPHSPSRIYIRADARRHAVRKLTRPTKIPGRLPHGPANIPPSYKKVKDACEANDNQAAVKHWYITAGSLGTTTITNRPSSHGNQRPEPAPPAIQAPPAQPRHGTFWAGEPTRERRASLR